MHDGCVLAKRPCAKVDEKGACESAVSGGWYVSRLTGQVTLMGTVFDVEEAAESQVRILFTLADIDEL